MPTTKTRRLKVSDMGRTKTVHVPARTVKLDVEGYEQFSFFIHRPFFRFDEDGTAIFRTGWKISELSSGFSLFAVPEDTQKKAIARAEKALREQTTPGQLAELVAKAIFRLI